MQRAWLLLFCVSFFCVLLFGSASIVHCQQKTTPLPSSHERFSVLSLLLSSISHSDWFARSFPFTALFSLVLSHSQRCSRPFFPHFGHSGRSLSIAASPYCYFLIPPFISLLPRPSCFVLLLALILRLLTFDSDTPKLPDSHTFRNSFPHLSLVVPSTIPPVHFVFPSSP